MKKREEMYREIEAEQSMMAQFIEESKKLSERSDALLSTCRSNATTQRGKTEEA